MISGPVSRLASDRFMAAPQLRVYLDDNRREYEPGGLLSGEYHVEWKAQSPPRAVELAVLWYTEGKGDEDMAVHHFERRASEQGLAAALEGPQRFAVTLPRSPLSYEGVLIKIRWCVRVRLFLPKGKEIVAQESFRLGHVPAVRDLPK
jgi:hypothetical protein